MTKEIKKRKIRILMLCHGNICRSTMAQSIFTSLADQRGVLSRFEIDSAATSREEIGNSMKRSRPAVGCSARCAPSTPLQTSSEASRAMALCKTLTNRHIQNNP